MLDGLVQLPWWGYVVCTLVLTQITIASVTLYLHRSQSHLALEFHPALAHFFRFWLWLTTGIKTREWVAVHRKHHARVESADDPHSPVVRGINRVLWLGVVLYRREAANQETLDKYGGGTPDDWVERNIYSRFAVFGGVILMLLIDFILFGVIGLAIWLVQMVWIPFWAAGVINGIGHYWGYRNFEVKDASKNIVPWGFFIGGEELHNNHHAYASSARFSNKPWEFDIGWIYVRVLRRAGLANVKKVAPRLVLNQSKVHLDVETARAVINNRFQVMSNFAKEVLNNVHAEELRRLGALDKTHLNSLKRARRLLCRESSLLNEKARQQLSNALDISPALQRVYAMKQRLQTVWTKSTASQEGLLQALEEWCHSAEASGIEALREFSKRLRRYELAPTPG